MSYNIWYVTGTSSGLGLSLVKELLAQGYKVAATSRSNQRLIEAVGDLAKNTDNFLPLEVDLTNEESVKNSVEATVSKFGSIDSVCANAGYDLIGAAEEFSNEEAHQLFEVNFFSVLTLLRNVLPVMRAKKHGLIFTVASVGALSPIALSPVYGASKAALVGMTEALRQEVAPLGIKVIPVLPGPFETRFYDPFNMKAVQNKIDDYKQFHQNSFLETPQSRKACDPDRAAKVYIEVSKLEDIPKLLILGSPGLDYANRKANLIKTETEKWRDYTYRCDYEDYTVFNKKNYLFFGLSIF